MLWTRRNKFHAIFQNHVHLLYVPAKKETDVLNRPWEHGGEETTQIKNKFVFRVNSKEKFTVFSNTGVTGNFK